MKNFRFVDLFCGGGHVALISPFLTRYNGGEDRNHEIGALRLWLDVNGEKK